MALTQISTAGVKDDAVTAGKIPANAVGSSEIATNAVGSSELADNAVDTAAIADDAVTAAKLASNAVVNASVDASAAIAGTKISPDFGTQSIIAKVNTFSDDINKVALTLSNNQSSGVQQYFQNASTGTGVSNGARIGLGNTDNFLIQHFEAKDIQIATNGTERMRIDSVGRVGIGTTSPTSFNPYANTLVAATSTNTGLTLSGNDASTNYSGLHFAAGTTVRGYLDQQLSSTGRMNLWNMANGYMAFGTNNTERLRILAAGGLTFNGDTAAANALDDYEEGTWSPAFRPFNNGTNATCTVYDANYTKVGRKVTFNTHIKLDAHPAGTTGGVAIIIGLPFASIAEHSSCTVSYWTGFAAAQMYLTATVQPSSTYLMFRHTTAVTSGPIASMDYDNNLQANSAVIISGTYFTAA